MLFMDDLKLFAKNEKEIDSLVQTVRIFSDDIGMKFGLEKCAAMTMKRGKKGTFGRNCFTRWHTIEGVG